MTTETKNSKTKIWGGWILSGILVLFFLLDSVMKIMKTPMAMKATTEFGYPEASVLWLGVVLFVSTILYVVPRTAFIGAILLTGYLGGATDCHVHAGQPYFFPIVFGILVWVGVSLRDPRLYKIALMCKE